MKQPTLFHEEIGRRPDYWMKVNVDELLHDLATLDRCDGGSYLLLYFRYRKTRAPLPNDDEVLARLAKVSLEEWLKKTRARLKPLFKITPKFWRHRGIDAQIRELEQASRRAAAAAQNRWEYERRGARQPAPITEEGASVLPPPAPSSAPRPILATSWKSFGVKRVIEVLGEREAASNGGMWCQRFKQNRRTFEAVLNETAEQLKLARLGQRDAIKNRGAFATDLWSRLSKPVPSFQNN